MTAVVELRDVHLTFGTASRAVSAVRGVSARVEARDAVALVGPSGSGKTSLLHLIAGLEAPTSGEVVWASGATPAADPRFVSVLFQAPSLIEELTAAENVALPLTLSGVGGLDAAVAAAAALGELDLLHVADSLPQELSGGQAQRVALARALVTGPRVLVADEPTGQLDRVTAGRVLDVLEQHRAETGLTIVVSTHDPAVAERFPTRWTMRDGLLPTSVVRA